MIHSFSCKNFYSFGELTTINFEVNGNAPQNNGYFKTVSGIRLSKIETVIGPNASGKTNLLKVPAFLKWLIVDSYTEKPDAPIVVKPFAFGELKDKPSELSVTFEIDGKIYIYSFELNQKRILKETLERTALVKEKKGTQKLFSRSWDEQKNIYAFEGENFNPLPDSFETFLRANASVIGTAARLNHDESQKISSYWQKLETNVFEAGWAGDYLLPNTIQQFWDAIGFFSDNPTLKEQAEKLLARFDLGFESFEIKKSKDENDENKIILRTRTFHSIKGEQYPFNITYESSGTKQLIIILKSILATLDNGNITIIDEFDVNLHPEMVIALFDLFIHPETNPRNAQLLLSTHSIQLLSKLDKYQIILVEKNEQGASESWRLDEVEGVRSDDNYYTKYIAGAYGALPKI